MSKNWITVILTISLLIFPSISYACNQGCTTQADGSCVCPNPKPKR